MSSSPLNQLQKPVILLGGAIVAFVLFVTRQPVEFEINTIWVTLVLILVFSSVVAIIKSLNLVLCTHVLFIDMPDPDNYAAALLRSYQSKINDNFLARVGRKVLKSLGLSLCPLYIVCAGRRVNLGLAHKNAHGRFFDESAKCWLNWDPNEHIGQLAADKDITCDSKTIEDSFLVLKKNMFDLDCILHSAGFADYVLVRGHIAKEIPLSYSHHADEWRFYNNVKKSWVSSAEYDQLSNRRCDESDDSQDSEQRRKLAHQVINKLTGALDFASSCFGSHWLSLNQFHTLLSKYSKIGLTVAGPATDMAYLVKKVSSWTGNVDSYYCPNCLENMPSAEAKVKKNRCANCFDCPSCGNTLSTRATAVAIQAEKGGDDAKAMQAKKVYYLACGFCRWSSRDVGIEDKSVASGAWQEQESPATKRVNVLVEYYRQLAQKEKVEREKKKLTKRRNFMHLSDKFGLSSLTRRKSSLSYLTASFSPKGKDIMDEEVNLKNPSEAVEEVETLPEEFYNKPLILEKVPNLSQRLCQPDFQPGAIGDLHPRHKHLLAKRSQRCRECEHNLSKPEFNPSSIKFKIQLGAVHYVPLLKISNVPVLKFGKVVLPTFPLMLGARDEAAEFDEIDSVVVNRQANKLWFLVKVLPQKPLGDVKFSMIMQYEYKHITTALVRGGQESEEQVVTLKHKLHINLGPVLTES
ncbi:hypothetical protein pdam_00002599 [Pocillopora damicornis]|uniref:Dynactin subunit 4 n=1 Tax=Pocillopora damicornis TaxID=46731 RepID=A0A3M6U375_POCDA|nr:hypothetical protein pdam_00002599 [Pocillopora damicornis]